MIWTRLKLYLIVGGGLLLVGLFLYLYIGRLEARVELAEKKATDQEQAATKLQHDLDLMVAEKAGRDSAGKQYQETLNKLQGISNQFSMTLLGYTDRSTDSAKCLDMAPPPDLLKQLQDAYLRGAPAVLPNGKLAVPSANKSGT